VSLTVKVGAGKVFRKGGGKGQIFFQEGGETYSYLDRNKYRGKKLRKGGGGEGGPLMFCGKGGGKKRMGSWLAGI